MSERSKVNAKKPEEKRNNPVSKAQKSSFSQTINSPIDKIMSLQRTIGNQAVQRMFNKLVGSKEQRAKSSEHCALRLSPCATVQAKPKIGQPNDVYEQEADRVADEVMRMPESQAHSREDLRKQPEEEEEVELLQAKEITEQNAETTPDQESRINTIMGGGQHLAESDRSFFELRFGHDFSRVRVHTDLQAAETAKVMNARAFTIGGDIIFNKGEYAPETMTGRKLLAHELTHVLQQANGDRITHIIQRLVTRDVTRERIDTRFLMLLTDEELQAQIDTLEFGLASTEPEEQSIETSELATIRSENLNRLTEERDLRGTVSTSPSATQSQQRGLAVIRRVRNEIRDAGQRFQVPPELIAAVIMYESQQRSFAEGAQAFIQGETASIGIGQMQVRTAEEMQRQFPSLPTGESSEHLLNERRAVQFVAAYLSFLMTQIENFLSEEGTIPNPDQLMNLTAIAYNMGWGNLRDRNLGDVNFGNTMAARVEYILRENRYIRGTTRYIPWIRQQVQLKLINGSPDDNYEHEADRIAEEVTRTPKPNIQLWPWSRPTPRTIVSDPEEEVEERYVRYEIVPIEAQPAQPLQPTGVEPSPDSVAELRDRGYLVHPDDPIRPVIPTQWATGRAPTQRLIAGAPEAEAAATAELARLTTERDRLNTELGESQEELVRHQEHYRRLQRVERGEATTEEGVPLGQRISQLRVRVNQIRRRIRNLTFEINQTQSELVEAQQLQQAVPPPSLGNPNAVEVDLNRTGVEVRQITGRQQETTEWRLDPLFALAMVNYLEEIRGMGVTVMWNQGFLRDPVSPDDTHSQGMACDIRGFTVHSQRIELSSNDDESAWFNTTDRILQLNQTYREVMLALANRMPAHFGQILGPGYNPMHMNHFHVQLRGTRRLAGLVAPATPE